ncbi:MAG TPA: energy transducer TonB [Thermoanaerobaculia bacterium]|nr:energy transducer TonB [Thermoanaerobaculia bacterium]
MSTRSAVPRWLIAAAAGVAIVVIMAILFLVVVRPRRAKPVRAETPEIEGVVTIPVADLKREASGTAAAAGALPRGTRVTIVSQHGEWLEIKSGKATAFVASSAVETDAEKQTREERAKRILSFKPLPGLVAEDTDVLLGAYPSAPRAGRLRRGTAVPVYAVDHDYYAVKSDEEGGIAFVRSADIDLVPPDPRLPAIVPAAGKTLKDVAISDSSAGSSPASPDLPGAQAGAAAPPATHAPAAPQGGSLDGESSPVGEEPLEPAALLSKVDPAYPAAARSAGVEGTVVLDAAISETGEVTSVTVVRGLPMGVSESAVAAVQRWRYRPARGRTGPVPSHKTVRIQFTLGE